MFFFKIQDKYGASDLVKTPVAFSCGRSVFTVRTCGQSSLASRRLSQALGASPWLKAKAEVWAVGCEEPAPVRRFCKKKSGDWKQSEVFRVILAGIGEVCLGLIVLGHLVWEIRLENFGTSALAHNLFEPRSPAGTGELLLHGALRALRIQSCEKAESNPLRTAERKHEEEERKQPWSRSLFLDSALPFCSFPIPEMIRERHFPSQPLEVISAEALKCCFALELCALAMPATKGQTLTMNVF